MSCRADPKTRRIVPTHGIKHRVDDPIYVSTGWAGAFARGAVVVDYGRNGGVVAGSASGGALPLQPFLSEGVRMSHANPYRSRVLPTLKGSVESSRGLSEATPPVSAPPPPPPYFSAAVVHRRFGLSGLLLAAGMTLIPSVGFAQDCLQWADRTPSTTGPSPRALHAMSYESAPRFCGRIET
jgi:hypothetical protein